MILFSDDEEDVDLTKIDISSVVEQAAATTTEAAIASEAAPAVATEPEVQDAPTNTGVENRMNKLAEKIAKASEETTEDSQPAEQEQPKAKKINVPVITPVEVRTEEQVKVDDMLTELDNIEAFLGMQYRFEDIKFPEPKPIYLPKPEPAPVQQHEPIIITKSDIAKLDDEQLAEIMRKFQRVDALVEEVEAIKNVIDDRLNLDFVAMYENILEKNNIEAIKTYRNVQAVVVEENAKQNRALFGIDGKSDSLKRRLNNVIIFSIVSFVVSILVMLIQILPAFGIDLF